MTSAPWLHSTVRQLDIFVYSRFNCEVVAIKYGQDYVM